MQCARAEGKRPGAWRGVIGGLVMSALAVLSGCAGPIITTSPGPVFMDPNGNAQLTVAIGGKDAGSPCLQGPVCMVVPR